jgi:K+-transporting ATPase ATPase C chain
MLRRQLLTGLLVTVCLTVLLGGVFPLVVWGVGQVAFNHQANGSFVKVNGKVVGSSLIGQAFTDKDGNPLPQYFQPRPSVTVDSNGNPLPYNAANSAGSNLGPSNPNLIGNNVGDAQDNPYRTPADPYCVPVQATDAKGNPQTDAQGNPVYEKNPDGTYVCDPNTVPQRVLAYRRLNGLPATIRVPVDAVTASASGLDPDITQANALLQANRVARARRLSVAAVVALIHQHVDNRAWGVLGEKTVNVLDLNLALDHLTPSG